MSRRKVNLDQFEQDIVRTRETIQQVEAKRADFGSRLSKILGETKLRELEIDTKTEDFDVVLQGNEAMQENIAALIFGLEDATTALGSEFAAMSETTIGEKVMSMFSKRKAQQMSADRVRNADISVSLNQLIRKSDQIREILTAQVATIEAEQAKNRAGLDKVQERSIEVSRDMADVKAEIEALTPKLIEIEGRLVEATGEARKLIERERTQTADRINVLKSNEQELAAELQSLERFSSQYTSYIDSLVKMGAAMRTMITKTKTDTDQRQIMYSTLVEAMRASSQLEVSHKINDIGTEVDAQGENRMTQMGIQSQNKVLSMLESHTEMMKRTDAVRNLGKTADEDFLRRFAKVRDKIETGRYVS